MAYRKGEFILITVIGLHLAAQELPKTSQLPLLPRHAVIIETADLSSVAGKPRVMMLWMDNPESNLDNRYRNMDGGECSYIPSGDFGKFWKGPARLSLVDSASAKLMNTVEIRSGCPGCGPREDSFSIPLCLFDPHEKGPSPRQKRPNLDLRDFTGEGAKAQFAMSEFEAFSIVSTGVFGYDVPTDRVVQYPIELRSGGQRALITLWTEQVFAREPVRPGHWNFTWEPGHGSDAILHEEVSFDTKRHLFVQKQTGTRRPYR